MSRSETIYIDIDDNCYKVDVDTFSAEIMTRDYPGCDASWEVTGITKITNDDEVEVEQGDLGIPELWFEEMVQDALEALEGL